MKRIVSNSAIVLFLFFLVSGCRSGKPAEEYSQKMTFNIDPSLIEAQVTDSVNHIVYSPPADWKLLPENVFERVKDGIKEQLPDSQYVLIKPVAFYADDSLKGVLSVSTVDFGKDKNAFAEKMKEYRKMLESKFGSNIKPASFTKGDIRIMQYLIQTSRQVTFKMVFENKSGQILQFDYISERNAYLNMVKAIESSIGSIQYTLH